MRSTIMPDGSAADRTKLRRHAAWPPSWRPPHRAWRHGPAIRLRLRHWCGWHIGLRTKFQFPPRDTSDPWVPRGRTEIYGQFHAKTEQVCRSHATKPSASITARRTAPAKAAPTWRKAFSAAYVAPKLAPITISLVRIWPRMPPKWIGEKITAALPMATSSAPSWPLRRCIRSAASGKAIGSGAPQKNSPAELVIACGACRHLRS